MNATRSAVERAGIYGQAAVQSLVENDWKALTDAHSTPLKRAEGAADLASWAIPEGKIAQLAGHALAKAAEVAAQHLATVGLEHAAEHVAGAAALAAEWANRTKNQKIAEQPPWNKSDIWERPLTDAERSGAFKNAGDAKALLGPATERGGVESDWHHIVESKTDKSFDAERVHNVKNLVSIERTPDHSAITASYKRNNPLLGRDADGNVQSLRKYLEDKPWVEHVDRGEQALKNRGLDPEALRGNTLERLDERLQLHDRLIEHSQERGTQHAVAPSPPSSPYSSDQKRSIDTATTEQRADRTQTRPPQTSHDDFARPRTQTRGDSPAREPVALHVERDGKLETVQRTHRFEGTIQSVEGDRVTQHIGRGQTVTWSRDELATHFNDPKALDAMLQPGSYANIGADRNGLVDVRQRAPDRSWESLGQQPLSPHQQSLGHGHGR